jgi:hypothetical protein
MSLDPENKDSYQRVYQLFHRVQSRFLTLSDKDNVSRVLFCLAVREGITCRSIVRLYDQREGDEAFVLDAAALLRCMFDAYLQAHHIVHDASKSEERATLYLEYQHVERFRARHDILRHDNTATRGAIKSPLKDEGDKRLQQQYDRVKGLFPGGRNRETRDKWYAGNLGQLAENAGLRDEYDTFIAQFNGAVHSSFYAIQSGDIVRASTALLLAATLTARMILLNVRHHNLELGEEDERDLCGLADKFLQ